MHKAIEKHIDRRALIKSAALTTAAATLAAVPTIAEAGTADPIVALAAKAQRLHALAIDVSARARAASDSVNRDCSGCGWPPITEEAKALRIPGKLGEAVDPEKLEEYNRVCLMLAHPGNRERIEQENAARLAWLHRRQAERAHNAEVSGYRRLADEAERRWNAWLDVVAEICGRQPVSVAGAVAQLAVAATIIRQDHTFNGKLDTDELSIGDLGALNASDALQRLMQQGDIA